MTPNQFWQKATDFYSIHHGKYRHAVLTDEEMRNTVTDFLADIEGLAGEWYSPDLDEFIKKAKENGCGAYAEYWKELGKPREWMGCSLPKGHSGDHRDKNEEEVITR